MDKYFLGEVNFTSKKEEDRYLEKYCSNQIKNTGKLAEKYIETILKDNNIKYTKNKKIKIDSIVDIIPDFYLEEYNLFIEVKSRGYFSPGTASEKIDNIPRKYSKLINTNVYKNSKVIIVFCANERLQKSTKEIVLQETEYTRDFVNLSKKYNIHSWIFCNDLKALLNREIKQKSYIKPRPFIKWVGGKTKIQDIILSNFPKEYKNYHELFCGAGSIAFNISNKTIYLNDINTKLINIYKVIRDNPKKLIDELNTTNKYINNLECFLRNRNRFNEDNVSPIEQSALFIYLNKTCFNGLYRENKLGKFNVPFGDMKNPKICNEELIYSTSNFLQNCYLNHSEYNSIENTKTINRNDLVYLDPPYHETFSNYNGSSFTEEDHTNLKKFVDELTSKNVYVLISNSNTQFINKLYSDYNITVIDTKYSIGKSRDKVEEVLIKNF